MPVAIFKVMGIKAGFAPADKPEIAIVGAGNLGSALALSPAPKIIVRFAMPGFS